MFGQFETDWPRLRQKLIDSGTLHGDERDLVSLFIGLQASRTSESFERREFVASVAAFSDERPLSRETVRRYLAELHLGFPPEDGEVAGAWTLANFVLDNGPMPSRDDSVKMATEFAVKELAPRIFARSWTIETCRKPILFTSDRPVMLWRPKSYRDKVEGVGWDTANEVRFPLSPNSLLVIRRAAGVPATERVEPKRFVQFNEDIVRQCFEFVIGSRRKVASLSELRLARQRPAVRFNMAPGYQVGPDGSAEPMGDIFQLYTPLRDDM